jgi:hypothetical protein
MATQQDHILNCSDHQDAEAQQFDGLGCEVTEQDERAAHCAQAERPLALMVQHRRTQDEEVSNERDQDDPLVDAFVSQKPHPGPGKEATE